MSQVQTAIPKPLLAGESRSYWFIFTLGFMVFLAIALFGQLLGWHWRTWLPGAEGVKSIFGGVKAAVYTFMSHLT
jgi:light-harvesting complex 1 beta chain